MLVVLPFVAVVLGEPFATREGKIVALMDEEDEIISGCNNGDFDTRDAQECCTMYVLSPSTVVKQSWGEMPAAKQQRWQALRCDRYASQLRNARKMHARLARQRDAAAARPTCGSTLCAPPVFAGRRAQRCCSMYLPSAEAEWPWTGEG